MKRFQAIEGLRGWLAWTVVLAHLAYCSGFNAGTLAAQFRSLGLPAVLVFLIVSGFVITHVVVEKSEAYPVYLVQRFARLFPLFAATCIVGFFTNDLLAISLASPGFNDSEFAKVVNGVAASNHKYFWSHLLAHVTMLHGAVSNAALPYSEYAFNMPAWSISLEFQFYLVAPLIICIIRNEIFIPVLAITVAVCEFWFKSFVGTVQPGALPLAASYFVVGIVSRLTYPYVEGHNWLVPAVALAIVLFPLRSELRPFLIWFIVFFGLPQKCHERPGLAANIYSWALTNPAAQYFGSRSYSIFLCHYPVISAIVWFVFSYSGVAPGILLLSCLSIPATIMVSEFTYRYIELPGIKMGKRAAAWMQPTIASGVASQ
ncbi:acyltransferase [Bradyrhizobium sp. 147]|uniref:acyltransferase family protein n=1 Tax=unclassified Bradyrhizobium TaxID=2631580 RepID=UPI001FF74F01|nr:MULTISPECIES: acyltransferase [unclassified Bradyrhizobium]MCK1682792.1 acyltransferase [Bradyrhizobium sp. 147]MCK1757597.1 acyltransferase [Bradyrhizobium sp. 137]